MSSYFNLSEKRVTILGLGLMGGSLAMALQGKCKGLSAYDPDPETVALASRQGTVQRASLDLKEVLLEADLVILAAPVRAILDLIQKLPDFHPGSPVVIDLGSTKEEICRQMEILPKRFDPIGGHPMCGKETSGLPYAEATIFDGAPFALVPLGRTSAQGRDVAEDLVRAIGSHPVWLEPATHDRWVAATSHLPYLLSSCLALSAPLEAAPMVGPGFRGATRLAASSVSMMLDALSTNRENILLAVESFRKQLDAIEAALEEPMPGELARILQSGRIARQQLIQELPGGASA